MKSFVEKNASIFFILYLMMTVLFICGLFDTQRATSRAIAAEVEQIPVVGRYQITTSFGDGWRLLFKIDTSTGQIWVNELQQNGFTSYKWQGWKELK